MRVCLDGFLNNELKSASRQKRGSGLVQAIDASSFDTDLASYARSEEPDPERWFYQEWVRSLFADALETLRARCDAAGHPQAFALFRRYDVDDEDGAARPTYASLAKDAGLKITDVTNELAWARRAFREIVLETLRRVCASDEEFRAEARDLLGVEPS